jgi:regulator of replication initiation timing
MDSPDRREIARLSIENERLRAEVENCRESVRQHIDVSTELAQENAALRARLATLEPVYQAAKRLVANWRDTKAEDISSQELEDAIDSALAAEGKQ